MKRQGGFTLIELVIVVAISGILASIVIGTRGTGMINFSHGEGKKIGQIVKLSKQGFISKTWEGQIIRGGMNGGSGAFGTVPFDFTVENDEMARQVEQYMASQAEVEVSYRIEGVYSPFRSESGGHFLVTITPLKLSTER